MSLNLKMERFKKIKLLIVTEKYGDFGNRLGRFARLFSVAEQEGAWLIDLSLFQYSYLFAPKNFAASLFFRALSFLNDHRLKKLERYLSRSKYVTLSHATAARVEGEFFPSSELQQEIRASSRAILLLTKNSFFVQMHETAIKKNSKAPIKYKLSELFLLRKKYLCTAKKLIATITPRSTNILLVAVHIRQGDYKTWNNGAYYFEEEVYAASMRNLLLTYENQRRPLHFMLITEAAIRLDAFEGLPFHFFGPQSIGVDQALLQQSNTIISTLSTFSMWASFLHDIPQGIIFTKDIPLCWNDLKVADLSF
ncbi:MAG: hypothetical protein ACOYK6_05520 [Chthoniobacterales bacterium]